METGILRFRMVSSILGVQSMLPVIQIFKQKQLSLEYEFNYLIVMIISIKAY